MKQKGLHITVGALPVTDTSAITPKVDMESELRMVKAALLYADHAKLCSINASMLMDMISFEGLSTKQRVDFLANLSRTVPQYNDSHFTREVLGRYKQLRSKRYSKKGQASLRAFEKELEDWWDTGELQRPLIRFRGAMIGFSEGIKNAAWDENFSFDAERVFNKDVAPVILDIEDEVKANPYLVELARNWINKSLLVAGGSALAVTLSHLSLPSIVALSIGAVVNTAITIRDARWR